MDKNHFSAKNQAAAITHAASRQTYYTLRLLADRDRVKVAYAAYAYFRWVDDCLDMELKSRAERSRFINRQQTLFETLSLGRDAGRLGDEESMLADLISSDQAQESGLRIYLRNMMAVMIFDAERRGKPVSQTELDEYTHHLAVAVTEYMHYFIGHGCKLPHNHTRYAAVTAAHIAHMLRDTHDDINAGYFNIPREVLAAANIGPDDVGHPAYRTWVRERVQFARQQFDLAYQYLAGVDSFRCRIAGHSYLSRFRSVLGLIESDEYLLRAEYPARRSLTGMLTFLGSLRASWSMNTSPHPATIRVAISEPRNTHE